MFTLEDVLHRLDLPDDHALWALDPPPPVIIRGRPTWPTKVIERWLSGPRHRPGDWRRLGAAVKAIKPSDRLKTAWAAVEGDAPNPRPDFPERVGALLAIFETEHFRGKLADAAAAVGRDVRFALCVWAALQDHARLVREHRDAAKHLGTLPTDRPAANPYGLDLAQSQANAARSCARGTVMHLAREIESTEAALWFVFGADPETIIPGIHPAAAAVNVALALGLRADLSDPPV